MADKIEQNNQEIRSAEAWRPVAKEELRSTNAKELRERRSEVIGELESMRKILDERNFNSEEREKWGKVNAYLGEYDAEIQRQEDLSAMSAVSWDAPEARSLPGMPVRETPGSESEIPADEKRALALQGWCLVQAGMGSQVTQRQMQASQECALNLGDRRAKFGFLSDSQRNELRNFMPKWKGETRDQSSALLNKGGALVGVDQRFMGNVERALLQFGGLRRVAQVVSTSRGEELPWPTNDDTGNSGRRIGENASSSTTDFTVGALRLGAHTYTSDFIKVPMELMQDSAVNLEALIGSMCGERIGRGQATDWVTGTGVSQPRGISQAAATGKTAAGTSAIAADELLDLQHSVDPSYRVGPSTGWLMHDNILLVVRKMKGGDGHYLLHENNAGEMSTLLGHPIVIDQAMQSSVATGTKTVIFGALGKYIIRDVAGIELMRADERFIDNHQVGFVCFARADGGLLDAGTNPVKALVQA